MFGKGIERLIHGMVVAYVNWFLYEHYFGQVNQTIGPRENLAV